MRDPANCGSCAHACLAGEACSMGQCAADCRMGLTNCTGSCVDKSSDPAHCGDCMTACAAGQKCSMGNCVGDCRASQLPMLHFCPAAHAVMQSPQCAGSELLSTQLPVQLVR